jgi:arsenate reductase
MNVPVRSVLREKETLFSSLNLSNPDLSDDQLIDAMIMHPILMNRPIVETPKGVRLCRPSELVLGLLDNPVSCFVKEDGEVVATTQT